MRSTGNEFDLVVYYISACAKTLSAMPEMAGRQLPISIGVALEEHPPNGNHKRIIVGTLDEQDVLQTLPMCYVDLTYDSKSIGVHHANRFLSLFVQTLEKWSP